jgi:hypothetical protein
MTTNNPSQTLPAHQTIFPDWFRWYQYLGSDWVLMPIRRNGIPFKGWSTHDWPQNNIIAKAVRLNSNLAVRLTDTQFVVCIRDDIDDLILEKLDERLEYGLAWAPCAEAPGCTHYYFRKPATERLPFGLRRKWPGVHIRSEGQCVIAAGSLSPAGFLYEWEWLGNHLSKAPEICPSNLI